MEWWNALILGIVQGLGEFLPISSSGHLVLLEKIMELPGNMLFYDTLLHFGTLVAVFVAFRKEIAELIKKPFQPLMGYLIVATIPAVVATVLFGDFFEETFGGEFLGWEFLVTSLILFATAGLAGGHVRQEKMGIFRSLFVGLMQTVAILPAVSRSGATIFGGLACKMNREDAAKFSFLLSIPAILGSLVWQAKDLLEMGSSNLSWSNAIIGMVAAAIVGFLAIKLVIGLVKKGKLWYFGIYTAALGIIVLLDQWVFHFRF